MTSTVNSKSSIYRFLTSVGVDKSEQDEWIEAYEMEEPDGDISFKEYYYESQEQMRMFASVDWDDNDSEVSRQLSEAYYLSL